MDVGSLRHCFNQGVGVGLIEEEEKNETNVETPI